MKTNVTLLKHRGLGLCFIFVGALLSGCGDSSDQTDYVALGASDAVGVGAVAPFKGYVFEIEDGLDADPSCKGADLKNLGIPGAKAGDIENAALPVAKQLNPDLVTLWTGNNDLISGDSVEEFEGKLHEILSELAGNTQAKIFVANIPEITKLPLFSEKPDSDVTLERVLAYNAAINRQASAVGATVIDLFTELPFDATLVSDDGFHPSNDGHKRIAQLFLDKIIPQVCVSE